MAEASMAIYDMSKLLVANEHPMDGIIFNKRIHKVSEKMKEKSYLLDRERYDFTVFLTAYANPKNITKELIPTLKNRGQVIFIDEQPDGAYEIWVRDIETNKNFVYYLFDYTKL